jgi:hypothetical protein
MATAVRAWRGDEPGLPPGEEQARRRWVGWRAGGTAREMFGEMPGLGLGELAEGGCYLSGLGRRGRDCGRTAEPRKMRGSLLAET